MEHCPYIPEQWNKQLACIGYSHHGKGVDYSKFTDELLRDVISGKRRPKFFSRISSYFEVDVDKFWARVAFLNFLPQAIGDSSHKYDTADREIHEQARLRVERFLQKHQPKRVIVFSTKAWNHFCLSDEEKQGRRCLALPIKGPNSRHKAEIGTYTVGSKQIQILGLPHPERANRQFMRNAVARFLGPNYSSFS